MDTQELIKKVRKIEIKTRGLSNQIFSGEYHSAFKGRGMAFSEVREYQRGDDVRLIDWNVTARSGTAHIKVFEEERELTVMLLVDVSGSENFGTNEKFKRELITELCAVISFSAIQNNDKIGVIFFSDKIEAFIPPKKGKTHILRIIRELIELRPENKGTDVELALQYLTNVIKKRCIAFVISDFKSKNFEDSLKIASKRHDTIAVRTYDKAEENISDLGLISFDDAETGETVWIDTSSKKVRDEYESQYKQFSEYIEKLFKKNSVDFISLRTDKSYITPLRKFFKKREGRR